MSAALCLPDLFAVLEEERRALLAGDYDQLDRYAEIKARSMPELAALPITHPAMGQLRATLARNADLLEAALTGLRETRTAIHGLGSRSTLTLYGPGGERQSVSNPTSIMERKA